MRRVSVLRIFVLALVILTVALAGCGGPKVYNLENQAALIGVGAGAAPGADDPFTFNMDAFPSLKLNYTPGILVKEQEVSDRTKYLAGDALSKEFSGTPQFMVDWLQETQKLTNVIFIIDKNGTIAWTGNFLYRLDLDELDGVVTQGLTGVKRMPFREAMEKFVVKGDTTKYDSKPISFEKGFFSGNRSIFIHKRLPEIDIKKADGTATTLEKQRGDKPAVVMFFMASGKQERSLSGDIDKVSDMAARWSDAIKGTGSVKEEARPQEFFQLMQNSYFVKQ
ncbi:hypothetical protein LGV61_06450 [Desulfurispirillum indicum]|uniref:hypothetical protein n=1 Tax=Desulfurispirillum indicum TaxID=936456 RepID=UPI001CFAA1C5|nr:hypothetical protein [Desulfurispirillum indicum]UCZ57908.1 hypothetical protein LGV61_06450 [Desulfurispirillum indicum]